MVLKTASVESATKEPVPEEKYRDNSKIETYQEGLSWETTICIEPSKETITVYCTENKQCNVDVELDFGLIEKRRLISDINKKFS
ncbi:MAG: hypothetical protein BA869_04950 [Desulfuromonadales bacterium C00003107]|jgi:hypothetical protein|nr:MAG: hypothetical protein BA869_04950 [Desulfuromonadales bacterium C00003107]